jgi:hypothetical protein
LARTHELALWSPTTASADPTEVVLAHRVERRGGEVRLGTSVSSASPRLGSDEPWANRGWPHRQRRRTVRRPSRPVVRRGAGLPPAPVQGPVLVRESGRAPTPAPRVPGAGPAISLSRSASHADRSRRGEFRAERDPRLAAGVLRRAYPSSTG